MTLRNTLCALVAGATMAAAPVPAQNSDSSYAIKLVEASEGVTHAGFALGAEPDGKTARIPHGESAVYRLNKAVRGWIEVVTVGVIPKSQIAQPGILTYEVDAKRPDGEWAPLGTAWVQGTEGVENSSFFDVRKAGLYSVSEVRVTNTYNKEVKAVREQLTPEELQERERKLKWLEEKLKELEKDRATEEEKLSVKREKLKIETRAPLKRYRDIGVDAIMESDYPEAMGPEYVP